MEDGSQTFTLSITNGDRIISFSIHIIGLRRREIDYRLRLTIPPWTWVQTIAENPLQGEEEVADFSSLS